MEEYVIAIKDQESLAVRTLYVNALGYSEAIELAQATMIYCETILFCSTEKNFKEMVYERLPGNRI